MIQASIGGDSGHEQLLSGFRISERSPVFMSDVTVNVTVAQPDPLAGNSLVDTGHRLVLLAGTPPVAVCNLNDLGWQADDKAADGIWSGRLDWQRLPVEDGPLSLRVEYTYRGHLLSELDCGELQVELSGWNINAPGISPAMESYAVSDQLLISASVEHQIAPARLYARIGDLQELELTDNGRDGDEIANDGIHSRKWRVSPELPFAQDVPVEFEIRFDNGTVLANVSGGSIAVRQPEQYITEFSLRDDSAPMIGYPLQFNLHLNDESVQTRVIVSVESRAYPGNALSGTVCDGMGMLDGRYQFTGDWQGAVDLSHLLNPGQEGLSLLAAMEVDNRVVCQRRIMLPPVLAPEVEIVEAHLEQDAVLDVDSLTLVRASTNPVLNMGGLRLMINGVNCGELRDNGGRFGHGAVHWKDEQENDGNWVGRLDLRAGLPLIRPGTPLLASIEYYVADQVYDSFDLGEIKLELPTTRITSMSFDPPVPLEHGRRVYVNVTFSEPVEQGYLEVEIPDHGLLVFWEVTGKSEVRQIMSWKPLPGAGVHGPPIARLKLDHDLPLVLSEFTGEEIVVTEHVARPGEQPPQEP
ncbi:hypothetical protein KDL44_05800 [bacterium]|nr:hypothetical protein [bacterium]